MVPAVESLAARLLARLDVVAAGGAPGLSGRVLRIESDPSNPPAEGYERLAGKDARGVDESPATFAARTAGYGLASDVYALEQDLLVPGERSYSVDYRATLLRFADVRVAADWLVDAQARLRAEPALEQVTVAVAPRLGDGAVAVGFAQDRDGDGKADSQTHAVRVRLGAIVADVRLVRSDLPHAAPAIRALAAAVAALARDQSACLVRGCLHPVPPPADLVLDAIGPGGERSGGSDLLSASGRAAG